MPAVSRTKFLTRAGWDHAPHLGAEERQNLLDSCPPHLRMARRDGLPTVGIGRVYPYAWEKLKCEPFPPPAHWPKFFALDPHWSRTAALWGMLDTESDILYFYSEYYEEELEPHKHALAIRMRGDWIRGVSDPAAAQSTAKDGEALIRSYRRAGLRLAKADNPVEAGIAAVWTRISEKRLRIFSTLNSFRFEYNQYHRDNNGKIVKKNDHLMDCMRYGVCSGMNVACAKSDAVRPQAAAFSGIADRRAGF